MVPCSAFVIASRVRLLLLFYDRSVEKWIENASEKRALNEVWGAFFYIGAVQWGTIPRKGAFCFFFLYFSTENSVFLEKVLQFGKDSFIIKA